MPTQPRATLLPPKSVFGMVWKMCGREAFLRAQNRKRLLLECLNEAHKKAMGKVACYAICILKDRYFMAASLEEDHSDWSRWAQKAPGDFATEVNQTTRRNGRRRSGHVGGSRPNTSPVEDVDAFKKLIYAMAYAPVRAGEATAPEDCWASTYSLYAFGKAEVRIKHITFPQWYMEMGLTMGHRQKAFRNEARAWYEAGLLNESIDYLNRNLPLGGDAYRMKLRDYRKKIREMYLARAGNLLLLTMQYAFAPSWAHGNAMADCAEKLAVDLARHLIWQKPP